MVDKKRVLLKEYLGVRIGDTKLGDKDFGVLSKGQTAEAVGSLFLFEGFKAEIERRAEIGEKVARLLLDQNCIVRITGGAPDRPWDEVMG